MTQVAQRNNHILQMLKRLKETLDNDKKKYADKVNVLVMTWERIAASAKEQRPLAAVCIVEKMYKDTLSIMLQGEWPKMSPVSKTHLMQMLNRCRTDLCKEMPWLHCKFRKLLELVNDPWTLPSLERILHKDPSPATPEQIVEFCESERGLLIVMRLTMLCSNRCEKVAIRLAEACFGALSGNNAALMNFFTTNEYNFIFDIYLCLLYKYKKLECIINELKSVSVADGFYLVLRLKKRSDMLEQKIWKFSHQVAAVAARYFVTVSMLSRTIPNSTLLKNLISGWLSMCNPKENNIESEVRKVMQPAETSEHIYIMAEVLTEISQRLGNQMYSSLIMELYIRALTADINYLERVKLQNDKEQMTTYEKHLASKFLALADLVKDHSGVRREFVLTAFSIHPTAEIYRRVEEEAVASGKASPHSTPTSQESIEVGVLSEGLSSLSSEEPEGKEAATDYSVNNDSQDSGAFVEISNRCPLHMPYDGIGPEGALCFQCGDFTGVQTPCSPPNQQQKKKERSLDALILIKGNTVTESLNYDVLSAPSQVLEAEKLGLSSQVCADLVTLLGSNRYHLLTWVLEWSELSSRCLRYMDEADTIKSGKKELKFLEIDYNQYKDWPENDDEADCIEKGYEQWLEDEETDFDTDSKRSNTDDSEELMIKTAIKRSQKQTGRYAESSSDSDDSRSRPRSRKRGRPKKQQKYYSDSGSVSDSLGNDGQKHKCLNKKSRAKSKDLRKTLGKLKVLEMAGDTNNFLLGNHSLPTDLLSNKVLDVPASAGSRSDPTVLKSLRAFRPNPHKVKNEEYIQSVTENCYKAVPNVQSTVFDCNDNKFVTKGERFNFESKDMEIHFKTSGVKTKKYNDVIRTIKEDLISVSNIPNVANNATVNVVHVHDTRKLDESPQGVQTSTTESHTVSAPSTLASRNLNFVSSPQKPKPEAESQGFEGLKPTSSQSTNQDAEASCPSSSAGAAIFRTNPATRHGVSGSNQNLTTLGSRQAGNKGVSQPQHVATVNRNSFSQTSNNTSQTLSVSNSVVGFVNTNNVKNAGQSFITQATRAPVQTARILAVPNADSPRFKVEGERTNVILNKNCGIQNIKTEAPTPCQEVAGNLNNGATQIKKVEECDTSAVKPTAGTLIHPASSENTSHNVPNSRLSLENTAQNIINPTKVTILTSKASDASDAPKAATEPAGINVVAVTTSNFITASKSNTAKYSTQSDQFFSRNISNKKSDPVSNSNTYSRNSIVSSRVSPQAVRSNNSKIPQAAVFQPNVSVANKSPLGNASIVKRSTSNPAVKSLTSTSLEGGGDPQNSTQSQEDISSHFAANSNVSNTRSLVFNASSVVTTTTATFTNSALRASAVGSNESSGLQSVTTFDQGTKISLQDDSNGISSVLGNKTSVPESGEVTAVTDSSPAKLEPGNILPSKNILATVLKKSSAEKLTPSISEGTSLYSVSNIRNSNENSNQCETVQNALNSQTSNNIIHYTAVNQLQPSIQAESLNSITGNKVERVTKQNESEAPQSVMSSPSQVKPLDINNETSSVGITMKDLEKIGSVQESNQPCQQQIVFQPKKNKSNSSPSSIQSESNFHKKQVLSNQKITILVQNNEGDREKSENPQKSKLNELLFRDDQKTCITFRAIKRTQSDGSPDESPAKKKGTEGSQNGESDEPMGVAEGQEVFTEKKEVNPSEPLCQYLVLEAINDPTGALPKFNQAFGKSYQIKIPQAVRPVEPNDSGGNDGTFSISDQGKPDTPIPNEQKVTSLLVQSQVPVTESPRVGNNFGIGQKPVRNIYIDKEIKWSVQQSVKSDEETLEPSNISTIQMTEVQQPGANTYQNLPKLGRSSVVQQLLKKVPTTGPATLQAVNSVNTLTARQIKSQDVSGSTLIYAAETRAQSQILIQRAVGRVNTPTISQVAPVIYTQNPNDQAAPPTQTLLLAAVPTATRGVVPGTQFVRLPSSSGVWKMAPSVNPPRIVQLRPQNLVLQGGQDQSLLMQSGQPVLLHHLTSLPLKPIGVVPNEIKTDQSSKVNVKNDIYNKGGGVLEDGKVCSTSLEVEQSSAKSETSSPAAVASEHETVSLMKDIKEFENVFEETKLKFEMEEQQGVCLPEVESVTEAKAPLTTVNVQAAVTSQPLQQTVLVQPQLMLHKPQMIITSAIPNQQTIFAQKIDKPLTLEKEPEKRLILTTKPKLSGDDGSQSHVAVAYVSHSAPPSVNVQKPLVVVTNYAPPTSPAPSITSQNSSSPNSVVSSVSFTGVSNSSSKTSAKPKSRSIKTIPNPSKSPPVAKPQQKPQEDASTAQKIYAILEEYAVQLRNSPDMNNRPAPRRRSNPPASANTKRKKTICKSKESFSDGDETNYVEDVTEPLPNSEDSSSGVTVLQVCVSSSH